MKKTSCILFCLFFMLSLLGCAGPADEITYDLPEGGVWYCDELAVQLDLRKNNGIVAPSYIIIDGNKVTCICEGEYSTPYLFLLCQESGVSDYGIGDIIYWWTFINQSEDQLVLEDYETGSQYCFKKVP